MALLPLDMPIRFDRFEIDTARRIVLADGQPLALGARAFDVLVCLVQRHDRLVTKQELLDDVWPGVAVEEHNVATQISTLRKLLGPQAIATVPGRGYRFVKAVDPVRATPLPPPPPAGQLTPMLGRDEDLAALAALLAEHRLVTVVGAGGMGKSLLARHVMAQHANRLPNGACWIELTGVGSAAALPAWIAHAVGVRLAGGDTVPALAASMAALSMLVVLDNAEHLADGVAALAAALLDAAPGLRLLSTSQVPLRMPTERVWRLAPLAVPPGPVAAAQAREFAAVALFLDRARSADAHFVLDDGRAADIAELCRQLDGVPLAIELAAVRAPLVGVQRLVAMLEHRLKLLTRSRDSRAPARQQTLRAALEWSHDLLDETERIVFRRLGTFVGHASLDMVQRLIADDEGPLDAWAVLDALGSLVDRSLVVLVPTGDDEPRYRLLESPRAFARDQLVAAGEYEVLRRRHAVAFAAQFDAAWHERWSGRVPVAEWQRRVLLDADNAREAIEVALAADDVATALALSCTLRLALPIYAQTERVRLARLCESLEGRLPRGRVRLRAQLLSMRRMVFSASTTDRLLDRVSEAVALARELDDPTGDRLDLYLNLCNWAFVASALAEPPRPRLRQVLAEIDAIESPDWPPHRLVEGCEARLIGRIPFDDDHRPVEMLQLTRRLFEAEQASGADSDDMIARLMDAEMACGHVARAIEIGEQALSRSGGSRDERRRFTIQANLTLGYLLQGSPARPRELLAESWPVAMRLGMHAFCSDQPALLCALEGRPRTAARLQGYADAQWASRNLQRHPNEQTVRERCLAIVHAALGASAADALLAEGRALRDDEIAEMAFARIDA